MATSLDNAALLTTQAIYHDPKRAEWTTQEFIAYHILITWYASVSHTQVEKLCKLQEVFYAMGYDKDFEMYLADSKFELPRMKKGGNRKQSPAMGVAALGRQNSFFPKLSSFFRTQWGEYSRKKNFRCKWGPKCPELHKFW